MTISSADCSFCHGKSALLAGVAAQLYSFFTDPSNYTRRTNPEGAFNFMVFLCYASMLFNTSATVTSFMLIARLNGVPYRAARGEPPYPPKAIVFASRSFLLQRYGVGTMWVLVLWHCEYKNMHFIVTSVAFLLTSDNMQGLYLIRSVYGLWSCR